MAALTDYNKKKIYTDATGQFPLHAYDGSQYVLLNYVYDANAFLVCPSKVEQKKI